jgi:RHS repeat-associated protein
MSRRTRLAAFGIAATAAILWQPEVAVQVTTAPDERVDDLVTRLSDRRVELRWSRIAGAVSYNVYRGPAPASLTLLRGGYVGANATITYLDSAVTNGLTYYYSVRWVSAGGIESAEGTVASSTPSARVTGQMPPTILSAPSTRAAVDKAYAYQVTASDPDAGDRLSYSLTPAPTGMVIGPTGLIQWQPAGPAGYRDVGVKVVDLGGRFATQLYRLWVDAPLNRPPVITSTPLTTAVAGQVYSYPVTASDPDPGDTLTFSLEEPPAGMSIIPTTGLITWTPGPNDVRTFNIKVKVSDSAGVAAYQSFPLTVAAGDTTPPAATVETPVNGSYVNVSRPAIHFSFADNDSRGVDLATVVIRIDGEDVTAQFAVTATQATGFPSTNLDQGPHAVQITLRDYSGNSTEATAKFTVDTTPPVLEIVTPPAGSVIAPSTLIVTGTVQDASSVDVTVNDVAAVITGNEWRVELASPPIGGYIINALATDRASNSTDASREVTVSDQALSVAIQAPVDGTLTRENQVTVIGTAEGPIGLTINVNGVAAGVTGAGPFRFTAIVSLNEGDNAIVARAEALGRLPATASVDVKRDSTPPVLDVTAPERISLTAKSQASAEANDPSGIARVVFSVNDGSGSALSSEPFRFEVAAPANAQNGDTIELRVDAEDHAGNVASVSKAVRVVSAGVIVGQVLSDVTGRPIAGATVTPGAGTATVTDDNGRYVLPASDAVTVLAIAMEGMTAAQRVLPPDPEAGVVPLDARLTPRGPPIAIGGQTVAALTGVEPRPWSGTLTVPADAFAEGTHIQLTALSPQGLSLPLPVGWSPLAAFELHTGSNPTVPLTLTISGISGATALVRHDSVTQAWRVTHPAVAVTSGSTTSTLPVTGTYAFVAADDSSLVVPAIDESLPGLPEIPLPDATTATASGAPQALSSSGGTVRGQVVVESPTAVPSGTVIQATLEEAYTLASGAEVSVEKRHQDVILYRSPGPDVATEPTQPAVALSSTFPVTPSRTFLPFELTHGNLHVEILSGRESARRSVGGSTAVDLENGRARLIIPAGSLPSDTAIDVRESELSSFLPRLAPVTPVAEVVIDLAGATLLQSAVISHAVQGLTAADTFLLTRVERLDGVPRVIVVSLAELVGGRLVSKLHPGLPGVRQGGRYVFYRVSVPIGFIGGIASITTGPASVVVSVQSLPFIALGGPDGSYAVAATAGAADVTAVLPGTNLVAHGTATVIGNATTALNLALGDAITTAIVTPAQGAVGVPTNTTIELDTTAAIDRTSATADTLRLFKGPVANAQSVLVQIVVSASGRTVSIVPATTLDPATAYTVVVAGLRDTHGALVVVPATTFSTRDHAASVLDPEALTFSMPDAGGLVHISAPAGSLPPITTILLVNTGNGVVLSLTAGNDGSLSGELPASIDDVLNVTLTDPNGTSINVNLSRYVGADGTTAIGAGGGVVRGPGGVEVRVPEGALDGGVTLKIEPFDGTAFPERPVFPEAQFSAGLRVVSPQMPTFRKPVTLVFPLPANLPAGAAPEDAFYYVYRRLEGPNGRVAFEAVDHAFVQGSGTDRKVVTASYPFAAAWHHFNGFDASGLLVSTDNALFYLMLTYDALYPGIPLKGVVTGRVVQPVTVDGKIDPAFRGVPGLSVRGSDAEGNPLLDPNSTGQNSRTIAITQQGPEPLEADGSCSTESLICGTYTFWDRWPTAGTVTVTATYKDHDYTATGYQDPPTTTVSPPPAIRHYLNRATVNITVPGETEPPPDPKIRAVLLGIDPDEGWPYPTRRPRDSIVPANTRVLIGFVGSCGDAVCTVQSAELDGAPLVRFQDPVGEYDALVGPFDLTTLGIRRLTATALDAFNNVVTTSLTFQVVSSAGNSETLPNDAPYVVADQTWPPSEGTGVDVATPIRIVFSEPVANIPGNVRLEQDSAGEVPVTLYGTDPSGGIHILAPGVDAATAVTALTIQPNASLKYSTRYLLSLLGGIRDFDPIPRTLQSTFETRFETLRLSALGRTEETVSKWPAPGIAVVGSRAYLAENDFKRGYLRVFDLTDPLVPRKMTTDPGNRIFAGRPMGISAQPGASPLVDEVAVIAGPADVSFPSNLLLYDVSDDPSPKISWVAAATLSNTAQTGIATRVALHRSRAYVLTTFKGLQVVDLTYARNQFSHGGDTAPMRIALNSDGQGWGQEAVVATIPPELTANGRRAFLSDVKVGDFTVDGFNRPLAVVAGEDFGLVLIDPSNGQKQRVRLEFPPRESNPARTFRITWGYAVALARVPMRDETGELHERHVAVVSGRGAEQVGDNVVSAPDLLMVIDLTDVASPEVLGYLALPRATDLTIHGSQAFVGERTLNYQTGELSDRVHIVDLSDPTNFRRLGHIEGMTGWLAVADLPSVGPVVFSTARTVESDPEPFVRSSSLQPQRALATLLTPKVVLQRIVNKTADLNCLAAGARVYFDVYRAARVTLKAGGGLMTGYPDTEPHCNDSVLPLPLELMPFGEGRHFFFIPSATLRQRLPEFTFEAYGESATDAGYRASGQFLEEVVTRTVLPIGHYLVKGVDLADGHVTQAATDIKLRGRNFDLDVIRTYSSQSPNLTDPLGAGWNWNFGATLVEDRTCKCVSVQTATGSQVFKTTDWRTFTRPKGHHTDLKANFTWPNGYVQVYEFKDKSGTIYRFVDISGNLPAQSDPANCGPIFRLDYIQEPHGDRLQFEYATFPATNVSRISEQHPDGSGEYTTVRSIRVHHAPVDGFFRIVAITVDGLGLSTEYRYHNDNLVGVTRKGNETISAGAMAWVESYEYDAQHRLKVHVDPNGNQQPSGSLRGRTEYDYAPAPIGPLAAPAIQVREFASGATLTTNFSYDVSQVAQGLKVTVTDPRGNDTVYTLNPYGSATKIEEPLGRTTSMTWADNDVLKTSETDALGRRTDFSYDSDGNLTVQSIITSDRGAVKTEYTYELRFNKLTLKRDAENRETRYTVDQDNGDVTKVVDPVGNITSNDFDTHGQLLSMTDPRGQVTTYGNYDLFGNARRITSPVGIVTTRAFDDLGRMTDSVDRFRDDSPTTYHETRLEYDVFDRVVRELRVAGGDEGNSDALTETTYYTAGQVKTKREPDGALTTFTLDDANRVIRSSTQVGEGGPLLLTETRYDENGNKASEKDRRGVARGFAYDKLNRLTEVTITGPTTETPLGRIAAYAYDLVGNKTAETDVASLTTQLEYDGLYQLKRKTLPESGPAGPLHEDYTHDRVGNQTSVTDANGHMSTTEYDGLDRVTKTTNALGQAVITTYADVPQGSVNKTEEHDLAKGLRVAYEYDPANRETARRVHLEGGGSAGEVHLTRTAYDDLLHTRSVTDPRGFVTKERLDGLDRVVEEIVDPQSLRLTTSTTYDGLGNPTAVTDRNGNTTRHEYDGLGRRLATVDAREQRTEFVYDGEGLKIAETDRRDVSTSFTFDNLRRPRLTTIAPTISGVAWSQEVRYDDLGRTRTEIDANGHATVLRLDGLNRVVRKTDPNGFFAVTGWDGVNKVSETDKRGNTTHFEYDALNRVIKTTDPAPFTAQTVEITYLDASNRKAERDRRGTQTITQTDSLARVRSITRAGVVLETNTFDGNDNKVATSDADGHTTHFAYDAADRLISETAGYGSNVASTTKFRYDANGNRTEERDARAAQVGEPFSKKSTYDELNRVLTVTDGEGGVTTYGYDAEGNRTLVRDALGNETTFAYDELDTLTSVTQPGGVVTRYGYDSNRNRLTQTDGNNHTVEMKYDKLNRMTDLIQFGGFTTTHEFDGNGNEVTLTDPKGQKTHSTFDELNRLHTVTYVALPEEVPLMWMRTTGVVYTRDQNGNLVQVDESVASGTDPPRALRTLRQYDALDRLVSDTTPLPDGKTATVTYTYFANGNRAGITVPDRPATTYTYDSQNRLDNVTTEAGTTRYTYYADGLQKETIHPNGVSATHQYDRADRVTSIVNGNPIETLSSYQYTYDAEGNRKSQIEVNGSAPELTTYTYDTFNRLKSVTYPIDLTFRNGRVVTYEYDGVGNRLREIERDSSGVLIADKGGTFDELNRQTRLDNLLDPSKSIIFGYDRNGNQTSRTTGGLETKYRYDSRDKLIELIGPGTVARFQYDFAGHRTKKIGNDGVRNYLHDGVSLVTEYDGSGIESAKYEYGTGQLVAAERRGEGKQFVSFDVLGSVVGLSNLIGVQAARYHFDAWGNYRLAPASEDRNRFGFGGYVWDVESSLSFAKARYYDPTLGRFITEDFEEHGTEVSDSSTKRQIANTPERVTNNLYAYTTNNPLTRVDPDGHNWFFVNGEWRYAEGDKYTYTNEADVTRVVKSKYEALLRVTPIGTNSRLAKTFHTTLFEQDKPVITSETYAGGGPKEEGGPFRATESGNYEFNLDKKDPVGPTVILRNQSVPNPPAHFGIQKINPDLSGDARASYEAYGPTRARLVPLDKNLEPLPEDKDTHGYYYHGQCYPSSDHMGWTHGCLSYGADTRTIDYLWERKGRVVVAVDVNVVPPETVDEKPKAIELPWWRRVLNVIKER